MTDQDLIRSLGGPTEVAKRLGYDKKPGGVQRVHNWLSRGIPAKVKLEHADLFLRPAHREQEPIATTHDS